MFQIFVKTINGKTITIDIEKNLTVLEFKKKILDKEGLPIRLQFLSFSSKTLGIDSKTLEDYNINKESTIHLGIKFTTK
jgi:ubiquitin-large subunit ribosomal protein L40e